MSQRIRLVSEKKPNIPTVLPIDLQYVSGKGLSESVGEVDFDDTSVDFLYSKYFVPPSGYSHLVLSGPCSPTYTRCLRKFLALFS